MFFNQKGQSTAEYAIVFGLVIAVAAGILQVALKGGLRQKNKQALDYMLTAGSDNTELAAADGEGSIALYNQDFRETTVKGGESYVDQSVLKQGGAEEKKQVQQTETKAVSIETIDEAGSAE